MLTHAEYLTPQARAHFGLRADPFRDDVESAEDVFLSHGHRLALEAMNDALRSHRMVAVVGESGAGKSVIRGLFRDRNRDPNRACIIEPQVLDAEDTEKRGKPLRGRDIQEAICHRMARGQSMPSSRQALQNRVEELLAQSVAANRRNLLLIEEAHTLPIPTLRQLKRLQEIGGGLRRLTGVLLVGQPELLDKLDIRQHWEAREVIQRVEISELKPLGSDLDAYVRFKFDRIERNVDEVIEPEAIGTLADLMRAKTSTQRNAEVTSFVYPLAVNNLLAKAINKAASIGAPLVEPDQIRAALGA
jgi:type II secretory pathway predicted ATPase ExeA